MKSERVSKLRLSLSFGESCLGKDKKTETYREADQEMERQRDGEEEEEREEGEKEQINIEGF